MSPVQTAWEPATWSTTRRLARFLLEWPVSLGSVISGTGSLTQAGSATVILAALNSFSGTTSIDPNTTLQVGSGDLAASLGTGSVVDNGSLVYDLTGL